MSNTQDGPKPAPAKPAPTKTARQERRAAMSPSRRYYNARFGSLMNSLRTELIVIGLFVVILSYAGHLANGYAFRLNDALLGGALLLLATAFTAYDVIAGQVFAQANHQSGPSGTVRPTAVIGLFFVDLGMFIVNLGILLMPLIIVMDIEIAGITAAHIFLFTAIWHGLNLLWYIVSPVQARDLIRHMFYIALNGGFFALFALNAYSGIASTLNMSIDALVVLHYAAVVGLIYAIQVRGYIRESAAG